VPQSVISNLNKIDNSFEDDFLPEIKESGRDRQIMMIKTNPIQPNNYGTHNFLYDLKVT